MQLFVRECAVPRAAALLVPLILSLALAGDRTSRQDQPQPPRSNSPRPNILVAIADDWSFPHAGVYGDRTVRTPHIDRLAREGVSVHACIRRGAVVHAIPSGAPDRPGGASPRRGRQPVGIAAGEHTASIRIFSRNGEATPSGSPARAGARAVSKPAAASGIPQVLSSRTSTSFSGQRPTGRPFCFWFGSTDPHRPYGAGTGVSLGRPAAAWSRSLVSSPTRRRCARDLLDYYFEVERFDRDVGAIVEALTRAGELDNTVVIVTSDNGMPFPRAKATVYNGGTRVPLVIRWPGVSKAGTTVSGLVSLTDVAPTLLEGTGKAGRFPHR